MKTKASLLLLACSIAVFACTKTSEKNLEDSHPTPVSPTSEMKYAVNFSFGTLSVDASGRVGSREVAASDYLSYVFYGAYDTMGKLVSKIIQDRFRGSFPHFGEISDSLKPGKYTIVLAGSTGTILEENTDTLINTLHFSNRAGGGDVFYKKLYVNISPSDTAYTNVKMERLTSLIEVTITDTLPSNVENVSISIDNLLTVFSPDTDSFSNVDSLSFSSLYDRTQPALSNFQLNFFGSNNKHKIIITAYTSYNRPVLQKVIDNIYLLPNKRVILKGRLSDGAIGNTPMILTVDPDYSETNTINF